MQNNYTGTTPISSKATVRLAKSVHLSCLDHGVGPQLLKQDSGEKYHLLCARCDPNFSKHWHQEFLDVVQVHCAFTRESLSLSFLPLSFAPNNHSGYSPILLAHLGSESDFVSKIEILKIMDICYTRLCEIPAPTQNKSLFTDCHFPNWDSCISGYQAPYHLSLTQRIDSGPPQWATGKRTDI